MARYLAFILAAVGAVSAAVVKDQRKEVCQFCHKLCPISCFVGSCGLDSAYSVRRYEATNQCYSCDPAVSVGISRDGDFLRCEASESGASQDGSSPFSQQQTAKQGPQGPAIPGNAGLNALKASQQAQIAVEAATRASILADKAAKAATAKYRQISGAGGNQVFSDESAAESHQTATMIRAEEALRTAETAHTMWKGAMAKYNEQLLLLRKQQIITDQADRALEAAEMVSEKARGEYAKLQGDAKHAMEQALLNGGSAASKITSQAAAEELAGAAMAAHRRLVIAAKEAKEASEKISMASAMAPCVSMFLQDARSPGAPAIIGCTSIGEKQEQDLKLAASKVPHFAVPALPKGPAPLMPSDPSVPGLGELDDSPAVPSEGELEVPSLEEQMTANLAEKLDANPGAVSDPALFSAPTVPFSADQVPVDGMEHVANFDLSTISALQKGERRMLRQGALHP